MFIVSVSYGHGTVNKDGTVSPSGKLYDYPTEKKYRTGDVIVVPVQHHVSHKLYNTLGVVRLTSKETSVKGTQKIDHLTDPNNSIKPKNTNMRLEIAKRDGFNVDNDRQVSIKLLPGYASKKSGEKWSMSQSSQEESTQEQGSSRIISRIK